MGRKKYGRYEVLETLGRGAMGVVYLAKDPVIGRRVALKIIREDIDLEEADLEQLEARFRREFHSAGILSHPNIVTVFDVGVEDIAMEYIDGDSLEKILKSSRKLTAAEIGDLAKQIGSGLDYAHKNGVIHRDIKPANIMIDDHFRPKISDFGVAKLDSTGMTRTGTLLGTPAYMSPEQVTGRKVAAASDQFSMAVILFELLTGDRPFEGTTPTTLMYQIVHEQPRSARSVNAQLSQQADEVLARGLAKDASHRFPGCEALGEAIDAALRGTYVGAPATSASSVGVDTRPDDATQVLSGVTMPAAPAAMAPPSGTPAAGPMTAPGVGQTASRRTPRPIDSTSPVQKARRGKKPVRYYLGDVVSRRRKQRRRIVWVLLAVVLTGGYFMWRQGMLPMERLQPYLDAAITRTESLLGVEIPRGEAESESISESVSEDAAIDSDPAEGDGDAPQ